MSGIISVTTLEGLVPAATISPEEGNNYPSNSDTYHDYGPVVISLYCLALSVIMMLALAGNCSVVYVIVKHPSMRYDKFKCLW